jgi:hypothetical protein
MRLRSVITLTPEGTAPMRINALAWTLGLAVLNGLAACSKTDVNKGGASAADYVAGTAASIERFSSPNGKFTVDLPGLWRGYYKGVERADTTAGAHFSVEFVFAPEAAWKAEPKTLMVIRVFPKPAWAAITAKPGPPIAVQIGARGDDIFALSFSGANPYKSGTPEAAKYDELMLSVINNPQGLSLVAK